MPFEQRFYMNNAELNSAIRLPPGTKHILWWKQKYSERSALKRKVLQMPKHNRESICMKGQRFEYRKDSLSIPRQTDMKKRVGAVFKSQLNTRQQRSPPREVKTKVFGTFPLELVICFNETLNMCNNSEDSSR